MTVAEMIEALKRYDGDREVIVSNGMFSHHVEVVRSVEPGGVIVIVEGNSHATVFGA